VVERWSTFDCYGTLVDWDSGIRRELERLFGVQEAPRLLARYHELEPELQQAGYRTYREVLTLALERLAAETGLSIPEGESASLARSLPDWPVFEEVPEALSELRARGWRLGVLSNSDRDLIAASEEAIGVSFDLTVVAEDVGSYKPAHGHWHRFFAQSGADRERHVHVAASSYHDIAPATELELKAVWVNRAGEEASAEPTREVTDLSSLPDALDELVPKEPSTDA
jgi:2-haloacid dehalogenase